MAQATSKEQYRKAWQAQLLNLVIVECDALDIDSELYAEMVSLRKKLAKCIDTVADYLELPEA